MSENGGTVNRSRPVIEFRSASYAVDDVQILSCIDLAVEKGEVLVLLGESGCGKTTTLKLINRLIDPTGGEVVVKGKPTTAWNPIELRRSIGYVLQEGGLFPHYSVEANVGIVPGLIGKDRQKTAERTFELLGLVGLDPSVFADRMPHELSGGQRQRVGVARALAADPSILLLDEPFGALDVLTRANLQKEFARLVRELGKTAVFVTHDITEAMRLGSRIALIDRGRLVFVGTPGEFSETQIPLARAYIESSFT